jgi:hypothetical protein
MKKHITKKATGYEIIKSYVDNLLIEVESLEKENKTLRKENKLLKKKHENTR